MAELDSLIGCKISLISHQDIRYDGTLFSINQNESSIALKNVQVFGTEDRVTDPAKKVAANAAFIPFVTFPGSEIKDLYVHEAGNSDAAASTAAAAATAAASAPAPPAPKADNRPRPPRNESRPAAVAPPQPPTVRDEKTRNDQYRGGPRRDQQQPPQQQQHHQNQNQQQPQHQHQQQQQQQQPRSVVGTGSHLLKLRERKVSSGGPGGDGGTAVDATVQDFDFEVGNKIFHKEDVVEEQAEVPGGGGQKKYLKDDFFDNLSNDVTERGEGRKTRLTAVEERQLNTDTFGAIALQNNYRRGGRGRGGRGGGYGQGQGQGQGRGYGNNNYGGYNRGRGGGGGYGQGQGRGGGRQQSA